jgi:serine/threonine-protein kinase
VKRIGRYEILRELGRGAMGIVFKARDPVIGRIVALKTITANVADDSDLMERFRREAKTAGALQHPNIVTVYEMSGANGIPLIAMEYLEGESLDTLIATNADLSLAQKIGYIVQTCRALSYAHQNRVIHRDIKPANIVVTAHGVVKVVDFGIARLSDTSKTQTGTLLGTLSYMAPQQLMGRPADERSDIWATGIVIYELLTYQRLFREENQAAVLFSILNHEPPPLSQQLRNCPPVLEALTQKALCKNDAERYQTMEELLLDLEPLWVSLQRELVDELLTESRRHSGSGHLLEARTVLRLTVQLDASNTTAKMLLEEVNARIAKGEGASGVRRHTDKAEKLIAQGQYVEARRELEAALKIARFDRIARRLLEEIPSEDESDFEEDLVKVSAGSIREYATKSGSSLQKTRIAGAPHSIASQQTKVADKQKELLNLSLDETRRSKAERKPWWMYVAACLLVGVIIVAGVAFRAKKLALAPLTRTLAPATSPSSSALIAPPAPSLSLEDQQQHLIDIAHKAADANDYATAQARLKDAEGLNGPLNSRIHDLQQRFSAEEHNGELQEIAHQESAFWGQALAQIASNHLDDAEKSFQQVLALPEGGRRRADAQHYLNRVIPNLRQEGQLWARAQQFSKTKDPDQLRQLEGLLDKIIAAQGPHLQEAERWRNDIASELVASVARKDPGTQVPAISESDRAHFAQLEDQYRKATQQSDAAALEQLRTLRTQFRAIQDAGGPLAVNAANYSNTLIPGAMKDVADRLANAQALALAESQLNDAVAHFNQAVAAKDSVGLKSRVLSEFQQLAQGGGPRAPEAARYVSTVIPAALRDITPWPTIGCPAGALGISATIKPGDLVACGMLDAPKLKWVQFAWPEFPARARDGGQPSGLAMLSIAVDENGNVTDVRPRGTKDSYGFFDAAVVAARQWKTNPPRAQGKSVKTLFAVDVNFTR